MKLKYISVIGIVLVLALAILGYIKKSEYDAWNNKVVRQNALSIQKAVNTLITDSNNLLKLRTLKMCSEP